MRCGERVQGRGQPPGARRAQQQKPCLISGLGCVARALETFRADPSFKEGIQRCFVDVGLCPLPGTRSFVRYPDSHILAKQLRAKRRQKWGATAKERHFNGGDVLDGFEFQLPPSDAEMDALQESVFGNIATSSAVASSPSLSFVQEGGAATIQDEFAGVFEQMQPVGAVAAAAFAASDAEPPPPGMEED